MKREFCIVKGEKVPVPVVGDLVVGGYGEREKHNGHYVDTSELRWLAPFSLLCIFGVIWLLIGAFTSISILSMMTVFALSTAAALLFPVFWTYAYRVDHALRRAWSKDHLLPLLVGKTEKYYQAIAKNTSLATQTTQDHPDETDSLATYFNRLLKAQVQTAARLRSQNDLLFAWNQAAPGDEPKEIAELRKQFSQSQAEFNKLQESFDSLVKNAGELAKARKREELLIQVQSDPTINMHSENSELINQVQGVIETATELKQLTSSF